MVKLRNLFTIVLSAILLVRFALSAAQTQISPSPTPGIGGDLFSPPPLAGAPVSPSPLPEFGSPPAPPPSDLTPVSSPSSSTAAPPSNESSAPAPSEPSDVSAGKSDVSADAGEEKESSGGLKVGQKAAIVVGVIACECLVGFGGMVYMKRQQNIRRSQSGYTPRGMSFSRDT